MAHGTPMHKFHKRTLDWRCLLYLFSRHIFLSVCCWDRLKTVIYFKRTQCGANKDVNFVEIRTTKCRNTVCRNAIIHRIFDFEKSLGYLFNFHVSRRNIHRKILFGVYHYILLYSIQFRRITCGKNEISLDISYISNLM